MTQGITGALPAPRAIIFDWDNTLVDSWLCIQAAMNTTLRAMDHDEWDLEETKRRVALSLRDSFPDLFGPRWQEARDVFYRAFSDIHLDYLAPLPGAAEMLQGLAELGLTLGVVSNKNGRFLRQEVRQLGWDGLFHRLVGATDASEDKPSAVPVRMCLDGAGVSAGPEVWFVGDSPIDMECAHNSGCVPILLRPDAWRDGEFDRFSPRSHLVHCRDFVTLVRELLVPISQI